jgi:hypothetical protein
MAITNVLRPIGPTTAVTVSGTSSTPVTISASGNNQMDFCAFLNTASTPVAITIAPVVNGSGTAGVSVLPSASTNNTIVLGVSMQMPMVVAVPQTFSITAIGTSGSLYITPVGDQS